MALDIEKCKECYYADEDGVCDKCCVDNAAFTPKRPNERICEWISVKDGLPEENGRYLCNIPILKGFQEVLDFATNLEEVDDYDFYNKNYAGFFCYDGECGFLECSEVTHWMPLPEPPKGE